MAVAVPTCPSCGETEGLYDLAPIPPLQHDDLEITWTKHQCPCGRVFVCRRERAVKKKPPRPPRS
jgi:predicted RNA-binding Zn-ribbon protein involved in translation (DUF1610 family)